MKKQQEKFEIKKEKNMYKVPTRTRTTIDLNQSIEGETIEQQITRLINDGAPVENEKIPIYTKPSDNVVYGTDIRGDKWDKAIEISDRINNDIDRMRKLKVVKNEDKTEEKEVEKGSDEARTEAKD